MAAEIEVQVLGEATIGIGPLVHKVTDLPTPGRVCVPVKWVSGDGVAYKRLWIEVLGHETVGMPDAHPDHYAVTALWCIAYRTEIPRSMSDGRHLVTELCEDAERGPSVARVVEVWTERGCDLCGGPATELMNVHPVGVLEGPGPDHIPEGVLVKLTDYGDFVRSTCIRSCGGAPEV